MSSAAPNPFDQGARRDADLREALSLGAEETPYDVLAVGHPAAH